LDAWHYLGINDISTAALRAISQYPETFICTAKQDEAPLFVPVVISASGENGSYFTSGMTLTNRGNNDATILFNYTASIGTGSGSASTLLPARQQLVIPDAMAYLKSLGIPLPDAGDRVGALWAYFSGVSAPSDAAITVRTTTAAAGGRAGVSYASVPESMGLSETSYLCGLRQNAEEHSDLALQNMGTTSAGEITLRVTLYDGGSRLSRVLPDFSLAPGEFRLISGILSSDGLELTNGYARVERIGGSAPYYAYAVINDPLNFDGSFVSPVTESEHAPRGLTLPVIMENGPYDSELIAANWSAQAKVIHFDFVADGIQTPSRTASFSISLGAGRQIIIPNVIQYLREQNVAGIGPRGTPYFGPVFASAEGSDCRGLFLGTRAALSMRRVRGKSRGYSQLPSAGDETVAGGKAVRHGAFHSAVPLGQASTASTWLYGLQQGGNSGSNLALVNTGEVDSSSSVFAIDLYDGTAGQKITTVEDISLKARGWLQFENLLKQYAPTVMQGYICVRQTAGINPFIAYAIMNDGCAY
jgi:hypothetical protein